MTNVSRKGDEAGAFRLSTTYTALVNQTFQTAFQIVPGEIDYSNLRVMWLVHFYKKVLWIDSITNAHFTPTFRLPFFKFIMQYLTGHVPVQKGRHPLEAKKHADVSSAWLCWKLIA